MASIQVLRELSSTLRSVKGDSTESQQALSKLSRELEIFIQRAERLKGERVGDLGLVAGIGGSEAELAATRRNLDEITQGFKEVNAASSGAFTGMVNSIRAAVINMEILNTEQRKLYSGFQAQVTPATTMHPLVERGGLAQPKREHLYAAAEMTRNIATTSKEAKQAMLLLADAIDKVAQRMTRTRGRMAVGPSAEELRNLEAALRLAENLKGEYAEVATAIREALGAVPMAPTKRGLLDQMGFREIGTGGLANIVDRLKTIREAQLGIAQAAAETKREYEQLNLVMGRDPSITGQRTLWGEELKPARAYRPPEGEDWSPLAHLQGYEDFEPSQEAQEAASPLLRLAQAGSELDKSFQVVSGSATQVGEVLRNNDQLMKAVVVGVEKLQARYKTAGLEADRFTVHIDAANKALEIQAHQAEAGVKQPRALEAAVEAGKLMPNIADIQDISESVRVSLGDAQIIDRAQELQKAFVNIGASATGVKNLQEALKGFGLTLDDIRGASYNANEGIIRFSASADAGAGIVRQASVVMDKNGEIVETVKRKYETFGNAISNSINKVIRWGIAVGLVYGSMGKLRQAITEMIDLETAFADITIITGKSVEDLGGALETIVEAAQATGISLSEATSAFEKALRAAGRTADEAERVAKAEQLMTDSLVLARLANVDQAQAIDMLTGALRQQGLEIDQGVQLLDKWVATSKTAYVSLEDLAESFAITAAQANAVGVEVDQLNGIIGTIAEVTTLSSTEIGNFARRLLSAFETDQATQTLQQYGIAVRDISGELRDWGEVMQDIYDFWRTGAISERELSSLGRVLGGGARQGPRTVAFIKEFGRVNEISAESAEANGDAAEALDIKMDTLRNTVNKLSVAFSTLASSLGQEGGLLEFLTNIVELTTRAVDVLGGLTNILGDTTTQVIALTAAYVTLSKAGVFQRLGGALAPAAAAGGATQLGMPGFGVGPGAADMGRAGTTLAGRALGIFKAGAPAVGTAIGVGALTYMTTGSAVQGAGAGIGGAIGGVLGGPVGMLAGAAIGNIIASQVVNALDQSELAHKLARDFSEDAEIDVGEAQQYFTDLANDMRDLGDIVSGKGPVTFGERFFEGWEDRRPEDILEFARAFTEEQRGALPEWVTDPSLTGGQAELAREIVSSVEMQERLLSALEENATAIEENTDALEDAPSRYAIELAEARREFEPGIKGVLETGRAERIQQFAAGEIPRAAYTRYLQVAEQLPQTIAQIMVLLEDEMTEAFGIGQEAANEMAMALADMDPAAITFIQERLAALQSVQADIDALGDSIGNTAIEMEYAGTLQREYSELAVTTSEEIVALIENAKSAAAEPIRPSFTRYEDITGTEFEQIYQQALANQREYAEFVDESAEDMAKAAEDWVYIVEGGLGEVSGLWKLFFDDAFQKFQEAREQMQEEEFHVRRLQDVDPSRIGEIQARNRYWIEYLSRLQGLTSEQYLAEEGFQENLILGPNNVWQKILTTSEAMSFTLQDILETEKKQLEGMWNIPEGATFWVPLTSLFYQDKGGAPGVPGLPPIDETAVEALKDAQARTGLGLMGIEAPEEVAEEHEDRRRYRGAGGRRGQYNRTQAERTLEELENLDATVKFLRTQALDAPIKPTEFFDQIAKLTNVVAGGQVDKDTVWSGYRSMYEQLVTELRPLLPDAASDKEIASYLLEAAGSLKESVKDGIPGGVGAEPIMDNVLKVGDSATRALDTITTFFGAPLELNAQFQIESEKALMIQNIITLDGSVIKAYISEIMAYETAKSAKATGFTATLMS